MKPTIEILISSPLSGSEATALRDIVAGLPAPALILANFEVGRGGASHQIDFVVITAVRAELIELKNFTAPVRGGCNGPWQIEISPGSFVPYPGQNPWEQARKAKEALSDAMHEYAKRRVAVPKPVGRRYYEQFDASVTVYPFLSAGSQVGSGNFKVRIRSFAETVAALTNRPIPVRSSWDLDDWKRFAVDYLRLVPVTLSQAIDATVFQANQFLEEYAARLRQPEIAPLLCAEDNELTGQNVVEGLKGPADILLLGRSGLGKSFHLEHYRRMCFDFGEIPIPVHGRHYRRDLNNAIHKSIGQYTRLTPAELLDAARRLGKRPVLIADGWNDCPGQMQTDLSDDIAAFRLRYDARIVAAAQISPPQPPFTAFERIELAPLRPQHKQAILAFHSGRQVEAISDHWYAPFSTAYDLSIAGRCHLNRAAIETRAELYGSYVRSVLPSLSARSLARNLAWYMGENFKLALALHEYEAIVEKFTRQLGIPLSVADELLKSRIFMASDLHIVTFEHDLLRDYFRAQHLLRDTDPEKLPERLAEPKYAGLSEFVIPSLMNERDARATLASSEVDILNLAFRGLLGSTAKQIVRVDCQRVLMECRDQLSDIVVEAWIGELADGRRFVSAAHVTAPRCASPSDTKLCAVLADNLDDDSIRAAFLELLEIGEWALKQASERAARELSIKPKAVWRELIRANVILSHPRPVHPLLLICHQIRQNRTLSPRHPQLPIRAALLKKLREGNAGALQLLLLMFDLRYSEFIDLADVLAIVRQAWDTGLPALRMEALDFVCSNSGAIRQRGAEAETAIVALLETFDVSQNVWLSTEWLEARACFSGFESGIDLDTAVHEFRQILAVAHKGDDPLLRLEQETNPSVTFTQFIASHAYSALGKIFENVFQGIYYEAYELLSDDEKRELLTLALQDSHIGLFTSWCLQQLGKFGWQGAEHILCRFGGRIDPDAFCHQDAVECFIVAHEAWAGCADEPIPYRDASSDDHRAWATVGELTFWSNHAQAKVPDRVAFLRSELMRYSRALPAVLKEVGMSHKNVGSAPALQLLMEKHADAIRYALHESLQCEGLLTSVFPTLNDEVFRWTISILGHIGNRETVTLLRRYAESAIYGKDAIRTIEQIEGRGATSDVGIMIA